ncbi:hypothetical protein EJ03DRAFT_291242 [Teratosphaeria nubilosa]|uniref:DUF2306 domain-containing protein n=1 Tax=Teratosphaeria nubilosa TaxID=161662 RepID=A0A6G1LDQ9_9PEZI|nr:hypothetical protein EJ03DRAFT_291242 [Teratosphaeria nubilosa]
MRKLYHPLGFSKGYNAVLWFLTIGYIFGFVCSRLFFFNFNGIFCNTAHPKKYGAAPLECFWHNQGIYAIAIRVHLYAIMPAGLLVCLQFVPAIRHYAILLHRLNGYLVILLCLVGNAGAVIMTRHSFSGDFTTQTWVGTVAILTTLGYLMAWINIKLLQIDQHRAWMMRTWVWFAQPVTFRIISKCAGPIITALQYWYTVVPCKEIASVLGQNGTLAFYPGCATYFDGTELAKQVIVHADIASKNPVEINSAIAISFGTCGWVSLLVHTLAIELYLRLTPKESERLRRISYERQLARGFKTPGFAGLVAERFGDAEPYRPRDV